MPSSFPSRPRPLARALAAALFGLALGVPAALLAVAIGALIDLLQKKVTPRGLQKEVGR